MPKVHQTNGLTCRRSAKMTWAVLLLQDTEALQTYEEYAIEFAYEMDGEQSPHTNASTRRHQHQKTQPPARGEPNSHTTANMGPPREPPE